MKNIVIIILCISMSASFTSCHDTTTPRSQYMPNMYESVAYETYSESNAFKSQRGLQGKEGQLPAEGSIKRGFVPYDYPNTPEALASIKATGVKSPLDSISDKDMEKAKNLFGIYCISCHGEAGDGKGKLVTQGKFLGVPSYKDREITEASVFHVVTYGLNAMGSHANQLSKDERWLVAAYVLKLKNQ
jgi:mono/diheme cytochrome c family protein